MWIFPNDTPCVCTLLLSEHTRIGEAYVNGFNISTEMHRVYERMGICPQFDVVWPSLTVMEHLLFYARLKGVQGGATVENAVALRAARQVKLHMALNKQSHELSGGMRRRLSLAISLIGNPSVVFLVSAL